MEIGYRIIFGLVELHLKMGAVDCGLRGTWVIIMLYLRYPGLHPGLIYVAPSALGNGMMINMLQGDIYIRRVRIELRSDLISPCIVTEITSTVVAT